MILRPPSSTLFPTRRSSDLLGRALALVRDLRARCPWDHAQTRDTLRPYLVEEALRSEEHTSELQSPDHLVCRLLLEKKKKQQHRNNVSNKHTPQVDDGLYSD